MSGGVWPGLHPTMKGGVMHSRAKKPQGSAALSEQHAALMQLYVLRNDVY